MTLLHLRFTIDPAIPIWVNYHGDCTYYESIKDVSREHLYREVRYITLDGDGVLTFELCK